MVPQPARRRLPLQHRLAFRFGLVLCAGVAAIFVALAFWNVGTQRSHMVRLTAEAAERSSALIRSATRDGMLHNEPERVQRVIRTMAASPGVHRVRIIDRHGRVRRTSEVTPIEEVLPLEAFQCQICHAHDPVPAHHGAERRMREIKTAGGALLLNVVEAVPNEPACSSTDCHAHPDDRRVLGIIDIELPLDEVNTLLDESETQLGVGLLLTLLGVLLLTGLLTWKMVLQPMHRLSAAAVLVAAGDLEARVPVTSPDEVGRMAGTWNEMVGELSRARDQLRAWSQTLEDRVQEKTVELKAAHERMLVVEKMASLGKLAAVVAHEINNPLAGIATYAKLLRRRFLQGDGPFEVAGAEAGAEAGEEGGTAGVLELVETEAARCGKIVRNLLLFSRTPGARFAPEDLGPLLERCAMLVHHQAELQEIEIVTDLDPQVPRVSCDASQVQQVILALVMNAIEAMPDGGEILLRVRRGPRAGHVALEVADTGCGIRPEDLPHVYEPFFTTKEQGEGVGLGLSVVYGIVRRHHGEVEVDSRPGEGTRFRVHLPLKQPPGSETPADEGGHVS